MQYQVDGVGVVAGADLDYEGPSAFPCDDCGAMVDLTSEITVKIMEADGSESEEKMTEAAARALLSVVNIPPPPVMCDQHDGVGPIGTEVLP
jgi:hypothetical protein